MSIRNPEDRKDNRHVGRRFFTRILAILHGWRVEGFRALRGGRRRADVVTGPEAPRPAHNRRILGERRDEWQ